METERNLKTYWHRFDKKNPDSTKNHDPDDHTHLEEIADDELNPVLDAVDGGVLPGQLDLVWVDVDGNDSLAGEGELDGVAAHAAEPVDYQVTPTPRISKL